MSFALARIPRTTAAALALALLPGGGFAQDLRHPSDSLQVIRMDQIVVTAAGFEQSRAVAPASISLLSGSELLAQRTVSLAEALRRVEGIDAEGTAGKTGGLNIGMRGMPSDYTLVLIDGRRQNVAGNIAPNGFGEISTSFLPPLSAIERVEVIRGPMATLYGSDAMGGVINIVTRKSAPRWTGSLTADATLQQNTDFGNTYTLSGTATGPLIRELLSLTIRGSGLHRRESTLKPTGEYGEGVEISRRGPSPVQADHRSWGGRLLLRPHSAHELTLDVDFFGQRYDNSKGQLGTLDRPDATPPTFNGYGPELRFERRQQTLAHSWRTGRGVLSTSLMRNATETIGRTIPPGTPGGLPGSGVPDKQPGSARELSAVNTVLDTKYTSGRGAHVFTAGAQYWDARMVDGVALAPFEYVQWALFAEDEIRLDEALRLTLGVRRDDHSTFGPHMSPRAYLVWNVTPEWTFKGGISRGYKTPRLEQLVDGIIGFVAQGRTALIGTPGLKPETSTTVELSASWERAGGASAAVTLFNNDFRDKISTGTPIPNCTFAAAPNQPGCVNYGDFPLQETFAQSVNVDRAVTRGAELSLHVPFARIWSVRGSYTHTRSEQLSGENRGLPLTNTPRHMLNGELRAQRHERVSTWLRGEYRSERARRLSAAPNPAWEALGDYRPHSLFHAGGSWQVSDKVALRATIYNLLNRDFLRYGAYPVESTAANPSGVAYTSLYHNHQEGRRLWLSTTVEF